MPATVSVLIAAYNAAPFLPAALAGLRAQTHRTWELIVVEDGSNDGTEDLVREFAAEVDQPVHYENLGRNRGVAAARNRLLELAQGDFLAFLDADDIWQTTHLATLLPGLIQGHALVFSAIERWDASTRRSLGTYSPAPALLAMPRRGLFVHSFIQTSSCAALPRRIAARTGRFDEALHIGEDRDFWFRALADGGTVACTGTPTCRYTKHATSSMNRSLRVAADTVRFYEKHALAGDIPSTLRRRCLADARWTLARLLHRTEPREARALAWRAWRATPWRPLLLLWCLAAPLRPRPLATP